MTAHTVGRALFNLVAPVSCAGCHRPDITLCQRCEQALTGPVRNPSVAVARGLYGVPIVSAGIYRGVRRSVVLEVKERGRFSLASALVTQDLVEQVTLVLAENPGAVLVPVPSSIRGVWQRGYSPTTLLAKTLSHKTGQPEVVDALHWVRQVDFKHGFFSRLRRQRSRQQRLHRTAHAFRVGMIPPSSDIILVDDVMATGATLEAAASALGQRGHRIRLAIVAAHVPQRVKTPISSIAKSGYSDNITLTRRT